MYAEGLLIAQYSYMALAHCLCDPASPGPAPTPRGGGHLLTESPDLLGPNDAGNMDRLWLTGAPAHGGGPSGAPAVCAGPLASPHVRWWLGTVLGLHERAAAGLPIFVA